MIIQTGADVKIIMNGNELSGKQKPWSVLATTNNHDGSQSKNLLPARIDLETPPNLDTFSKNIYGINSVRLYLYSYFVGYLTCTSYLICE
jgi:hypothetical protein